MNINHFLTLPIPNSIQRNLTTFFQKSIKSLFLTWSRLHLIIQLHDKFLTTHYPINRNPTQNGKTTRLAINVNISRNKFAESVFLSSLGQRRESHKLKIQNGYSEVALELVECLTSFMTNGQTTKNGLYQDQHKLMIVP